MNASGFGWHLIVNVQNAKARVAAERIVTPVQALNNVISVSAVEV